jgi:hypothetical protein
MLQVREEGVTRIADVSENDVNATAISDVHSSLSRGTVQQPHDSGASNDDSDYVQDDDEVRAASHDSPFRGANEGIDSSSSHQKHSVHATMLCEGPHGERLHKLEHFCHEAALAILCVFVAELAAKAWVNYEHFISSSLHILDLVVVCMSFFMDFILPMIMPIGELQADVMKIPLLMVRLWRIVRIVHASGEVVHKGYDYVKELRNRIIDKESEIRRLKVELETAKKGRASPQTSPRVREMCSMLNAEACTV